MKFLVLLPALIHVYIFVLESLLWGKPRTNQTFGLAEADVAATRSMAFNQGFYNLLLAIALIAGLVLFHVPTSNPLISVIGLTLMFYGAFSILIAGLVLVISAPRLWRSALVQIGPALLGLLGLLV